jgi:hypothetical protein
MFTVLSNTRNSNLYLVAALAVMVVVLLTFAVAPSIRVGNSAGIPVTGAESQNINLEFRRGEWMTGASAFQAYLDQRFGEQHQGKVISAQAAYLEQRHGEQTIGRNDTYLPLPPGKQAIIDAGKAAYLEFRRGEWSGK